MAYDILLGQTRRNWSINLSGMGVWMPDPAHKELALKTEANIASKDLAKFTRNEIEANTREMIRLTNAKRLPEVERKAFGGFFRKWLNFWEDKRGVFDGVDYVSLWNFRKANERFTERLKVFSQMAKAPLNKPIAKPSAPRVSSTEMVRFHPPGYLAPSAPRPWSMILGIGLGLAGLGFLVNKR